MAQHQFQYLSTRCQTVVPLKWNSCASAKNAFGGEWCYMTKREIAYTCIIKFEFAKVAGHENYRYVLNCFRSLRAPVNVPWPDGWQESPGLVYWPMWTFLADLHTHSLIVMQCCKILLLRLSKDDWSPMTSHKLPSSLSSSAIQIQSEASRCHRDGCNPLTEKDAVCLDVSSLVSILTIHFEAHEIGCLITELWATPFSMAFLRKLKRFFLVLFIFVHVFTHRLLNRT